MNGPSYTFDNPCGDVQRAGATLKALGLTVAPGPDPKRVLVTADTGGQVDTTAVAIALSNLAVAAAEATVTTGSTTEGSTPPAGTAPAVSTAPPATAPAVAPTAPATAPAVAGAVSPAPAVAPATAVAPAAPSAGK